MESISYGVVRAVFADRGIVRNDAGDSFFTGNEIMHKLFEKDVILLVKLGR